LWLCYHRLQRLRKLRNINSLRPGAECTCGIQGSRDFNVEELFGRGWIWRSNADDVGSLRVWESKLLSWARSAGLQQFRVVQEFESRWLWSLGRDVIFGICCKHSQRPRSFHSLHQDHSSARAEPKFSYLCISPI
jgi:hypothetical protein